MTERNVPSIKKVYIGVYGCQMNLSDTERMAGLLETAGYRKTDAMEEADLILLNTCCVRETAEDKVYGKIGEIKHLKKAKSNLIFGIVGCMAQKEGARLIARAPHIDFVLGTDKFQCLIPTVTEIEAKRDRHIVDVEWEGVSPAEGLPVARSGQFSAWIPIMFGCNNFCTYCIVPYVRGRERSRRPEDILREIRQAARDGFREITLLGQNVNSYGKDHRQADFSDLLKMADEVEGIERIRYMTSHPKDLSYKLIETVRDSRHICEHFHIPVQYGNDRILKAMNRGYTVERYRALVQEIRDALPAASITTDLIVGFPGEEETDFVQMLNFVEDMRYDAAYTFLYSTRSGTPAAKMDHQVPNDVKKERLHRLMEVQDAISREVNESYRGRTVDVMVEGPSAHRPDVWTGRTRTNKIVLWDHQNECPGDMVDVVITQPQTWLLKGDLVGTKLRGNGALQ